MRNIEVHNNPETNIEIGDEEWDEELSSLKRESGANMRLPSGLMHDGVEDHFLLPDECFDYGDGVSLKGVRNLTFVRNISVMGGPTTHIVRKTDPSQKAYAVYFYSGDGTDVVVEF